MKKLLAILVALTLSMALCGGLCSFAKTGDVNGDGTLSIRDVSMLLLYLANPDVTVDVTTLDVNGDTTVSISDVTALLTLLSDVVVPSIDLEYDEEIDLSSLTDGQVVTLTTGGTYLVTGTAANAQIKMNNKAEAFNLLLCDASITFLGEGAAIQADKCDECTITMVAGTENYIADSADNAEDAALQVKGGDLKLKGAGKLTVNSKTEGIYNTKDLKIDGPTVDVTSKNHGVVVKKTITVKSGSLTVNAKGDGLKAKGDVGDDGVTHAAGTGVVTIEGGNVNITATKDGFDCEEGVILTGGTVTVDAKGDGIKAVDYIEISGGVQTVYALEDGIKTTGGALTISGGDIYVEATGDGINAETDLTVTGTPVIDVTTGGGHTVAADPAVSCVGFKALGALVIEGGELTVDSAMYCYYGASVAVSVTPASAQFGSGYTLTYVVPAV